MKKKKSILLLTFAISFCSPAQTTMTDSIQKLEVVTVSDVKLKKYASGYKVTIINDSIINKSAQSLTNVLALNSNIYFKEFGSGMLSSPSFRGTNASQTAVIWNGININSQLNGQTDFNNEVASNYSSIAIRSGGGSVQYGSGAIGGSVHLNNKLKFTKHFENNLRVAYGSFDTSRVNYLMSSGDSKWTTSVGLSYIDSENDYKFLGTDAVNSNGQHNAVNLSANLGYFISEKNILKLYHNSFTGNRNLSRTLTTLTRDKYESDNARSLLEWTHLALRYHSKLKIAYLSEAYRYFTDNQTNNFTSGRTNSLIAKHDFEYHTTSNINIRSVIDYTRIKGEGNSFGMPFREAFSLTLILKQQLSDKLQYGLSLRQDYTSDFKSPLVGSIDAKYDVSKHYIIKLNGSKNFRVPTFNDLYWQPGGNLDLRPETSYQADFGQVFKLKPIHLAFNVYYIRTNGMIQWQPNSSGFWSPININNANSYGTELEFKTKHRFGMHQLNFNANYSYTVSKDIDTGKQLVYVPFNKTNGTFTYHYKKITTYYQHYFVGGVFTTKDNINNSLFALEPYDVANLGASYTFTSNLNYEMGLLVNNLYNTYYENVALRPMPNRNFQIQLTIKF